MLKSRFIVRLMPFKIGRIASENAIVELISTKCMSVLLHGVEVCPLRKSHIDSLQFAVNGCFMKIFDTKCKETVYECMDVFGCFAISNIVKQRKSKFLHKFISLKKVADLYGQCLSPLPKEEITI